jgi:hypothetical protein
LVVTVRRQLPLIYKEKLRDAAENALVLKMAFLRKNYVAQMVNSAD